MGGKEAEDQAAEYLQRQGLAIVARNWRCRGGEIDLVCRHGGAPASITAAKRQRLILAARHYLAGLGRLPQCRFDAVLIDAGRLTWLQDAFQAEA
jgi:putative endonuclease